MSDQLCSVSESLPPVFSEGYVETGDPARPVAALHNLWRAPCTRCRCPTYAISALMICNRGAIRPVWQFQCWGCKFCVLVNDRTGESLSISFCDIVAGIDMLREHPERNGEILAMFAPLFEIELE